MSSLVTCAARAKAASTSDGLPRCQLKTVLSGATSCTTVPAPAAFAVSTTAGSTS